MHTKTFLSMVLIGEGEKAVIHCYTDNDKMSAAVLFQKGRDIFLSPTRVQLTTSGSHSHVSASLHLTSAPPRWAAGWNLGAVGRHRGEFGSRYEVPAASKNIAKAPAARISCP